jgi:hypothetical protein
MREKLKRKSMHTSTEVACVWTQGLRERGARKEEAARAGSSWQFWQLTAKGGHERVFLDTMGGEWVLGGLLFELVFKCQ